MIKIGEWDFRCPNCNADVESEGDIIEDEYIVEDEPHEYQLWECPCGKRYLNRYWEDGEEHMEWYEE